MKIIKKVNSQRVLNKRLLKACKSGNLEKIKELIKDGANINGMTQDFIENFTPLHIAVHKGNIKIVKYLVESGANINLPGGLEDRVPAFYAALKGCYKIVQYLVDQGSKSEIYSQVILRSSVGNKNLVRYSYHVDERTKKIVEKNKKKMDKLRLSLDLFKKKRFNSKTAKKEALNIVRSFLVIKNKSTPHIDRVALDGLVKMHQKHKDLFFKNEIYKFYKIISFSNLQFFKYKSACFFAAFAGKKIKDSNGDTIQDVILKHKNLLLLFPAYTPIMLLSRWDIFSETVNLKRLLAPKYFGKKCNPDNHWDDPKELKYLFQVRELALKQRAKKFLGYLVSAVTFLLRLYKKFPAGVGANIFKFMGDVGGVDLLQAIKRRKKSKLCVIL
ncbi:ankyrin repeat domain-containing protein [Candidatus Dependentiae bacterium]